MLNLEVLSSSSKGNCYVIKTSDETLLLECGLTYKQIAKGIDYNFINVVGCLVSHEHKDHSKAVVELAEKGVELFMSTGTVMNLGVSSPSIHIAESEKQFKLGKFSILAFSTEHDAKEPLGFLIYHKEFGKLLFATDTYYIKYKFKGLNHIMIECNYSKPILQKNIEKGLIHKSMKKRLLASHFSFENVKKFLQANDLSKVEQIMLLHLSDGNSDARLFKSDIEKLTGVPTIVC